MVRNYIKKKSTNLEDMECKIQEAIKEVKEGKCVKRAAEDNEVKHTTLFYRIKKLKTAEGDWISNDEPQFHSKYTVYQVFTNDQESLLVKYIIRCSKINYGLTCKQIRKLAYDYATKSNIKIINKWKETHLAGVDWLTGFMKRHPELSIRKPEKTSLSRATSFNKPNVMVFFDLYEKALKKFPVSSDRIFNVDETGVSTVLDPPRIVAEKGTKQVGQCVSAERGQMITLVMTVSATGQVVPPVFIFPRARMNDVLMIGAPQGSLGLANSTTSAWINSALFVKVLEHIKKFTRCTIDDKIILLMDNHESHCSFEVVQYAKENGIVLVTFPPHCTHRLQPLDVGILGPFKTHVKTAQNDWMTNNAGKTLKIHDIPNLVKEPFQLAFNMRNITSAFKKTGLWPFSRLVFTDEDFAASYVTDRPQPEEHIISNSPVETEDDVIKAVPETNENVPGSTESVQIVLPSTPSESQLVVSTGNLIQYFDYNEFFMKKLILNNYFHTHR